MLLNIFTKQKCHANECFTLQELSTIESSEINFAYLKRPVNEEISLYANLLTEEKFTGIHETVTRSTIKSTVSEKLDNYQWHLTGKCLLIDDIHALTTAFMNVTHMNTVQLHLKVVSDDACRKFHTDAYDLRLLCTYVGKGTEWIEDQYVNRNKIARGTNEEIIKDYTKVKTMEPFEVAILKGEIPLRPECKGIVHRSPPIEQAGERRVLLRIDSNS